MKLNRPLAEVFVPEGIAVSEALTRTTHMGIGAHQDDLEIMAFHGIMACFETNQRWFTGIVCSDGAGGPRGPAYRHWRAAEIKRLRRSEQRNAAAVGRYSAVVQLDYPSAAVKDPRNEAFHQDLQRLLAMSCPQVVYTHNLADRHATHVAVVVQVIGAVRQLSPDQRPQRLYGCEVWGALDWLPGDGKVMLDVSGHDPLAAALIGLYHTQVNAQKRYDLATLGRRRANATYLESHALGAAEQVILAMDLAPLIADPGLDPVEYVKGLMHRAQTETIERLAGYARTNPF
jgi:LmbE family N-acetylglucosaminyl deacetylase